MMQSQESKPLVRYGLLKGFKLADTLLLLGCREGIRRFARALEGARPGRVELDALTFVKREAGPNVSVVLGSRDVSELVANCAASSTILWELGGSSADYVSSALRVLSDGSKPGHCYLETSGHIQIIASCDEYDESIFTRTPIVG